jgi:hypothetical protein
MVKEMDCLKAENAALRAQAPSSEVAELLEIEACRKRIVAAGCAVTESIGPLPSQHSVSVCNPAGYALDRVRTKTLGSRVHQWTVSAEQAETWAAARKPAPVLSEHITKMSPGECAKVADNMQWPDAQSACEAIATAGPLGADQAAHIIIRKTAHYVGRLRDDDRIILSGGETS